MWFHFDLIPKLTVSAPCVKLTFASWIIFSIVIKIGWFNFHVGIDGERDCFLCENFTTSTLSEHLVIFLLPQLSV